MEGRSRGHASNELRDILDFKKNLTVHCTIFFFFYLIQILTPLTTASQFLSSFQQKKIKIKILQLQILILKILKLLVAPLIEESLATNVQLQPKQDFTQSFHASDNSFWSEHT